MQQLCIVLILLLVFGCSRHSDKGTQLNGAVATELTGVWSRGCQKFGNYYYEILSFNFGGTQAEMVEQIYQDTECKEKIETVKASGSYVIGNNYGAGKEFDLDYKDSGVVTHSEELTKLYNQIKYCGLSDWKTNETRSCNSNLKIVYQIFTIEGNKLNFGKIDSSNSGATPEKRPSEINTAITLLRN